MRLFFFLFSITPSPPMDHKDWVKAPNMGRKDFWYNSLGEVKKEVDANSNTLTYSYDELGRMTERKTNGVRSGYWYYDNGDTENYRGLLRWEYNVPTDGDRLIKFHYYGKTSSGKLHSTQTKYRVFEDGVPTDYDTLYYIDNNYGRPKGMKYNTTGLSLAYEYNDHGYMTKLKNVATGYVCQSIEDMDAFGNVTSQKTTNGLMTQTAAYHAATGQMTAITSSMTQGAAIRHELSYSYDGFSNLDSQVVTTSNGAQHEENYQYDLLHRLTTSQRCYAGSCPASDTISYNYDAVGNMTLKSDHATSYNYGNTARSTRNAGPNAVHSITKADGSGYINYTYDLNGNLTSANSYNTSWVLDSAKSKSISYNEFNKPLTIQQGGTISSFSYGADLMRYKQIKTTGNTTETTYYLDKAMEKVETKVNDVVTKTEYRHYIGDVAVVTKEEASSQTEWKIGFTHRDRLGSVVTVTDGLGNVQEHRSYDPFGKPRKGDLKTPTSSTLLASIQEDPHGGSELITPRGFTDHEHLDDFELIHMNGRAYDYNLGKVLEC